MKAWGLPIGSIVVSFLGLPSRILNINHRKEKLVYFGAGVWVVSFGLSGVPGEKLEAMGLRLRGSLLKVALGCRQPTKKEPSTKKSQSGRQR